MDYDDLDEEEMAEIRAIEAREAQLAKLIKETGCDIIQENGQRIFGGPPPNWDGPPPPKGCEIFVGRLPRDTFEDEIIKVFSTIGPIYELRLMMDFGGSNRGFCFIKYTNCADANKAIATMDNYEIRPNFRIGVRKSINNCRLFIGGIPKDKSREEIREEMERITEGIADVIVYSSIVDKKKNRGFAFVEYVNHRAASKARRKLIPDRVQLWGKVIAVDWAEPEPDVAEEIMNHVTVLYVRNLSLTTTEHEIKTLFNKFSDNGVEKVKMMRDFAFVHFSSRAKADQARESLDHIEFNGSCIEVTWAKPAKEKKHVKSNSRKNSQCSCTSSSPSPSPRNSVHQLPAGFLHGSSTDSEFPFGAQFSPRPPPYWPLQQIWPTPPRFVPPPAVLPTLSLPPAPISYGSGSLGTMRFPPTSTSFANENRSDVNGNRKMSAPVIELGGTQKPAQRVRRFGDPIGPSGLVYQQPNVVTPLHAAPAWVPLGSLNCPPTTHSTSSQSDYNCVLAELDSLNNQMNQLNRYSSFNWPHGLPMQSGALEGGQNRRQLNGLLSTRLVQS